MRLRPVLLAVGALLLLVALAGIAAHFRTPHRSTLIGVSAFAPYLMLAAPVAVALFGGLRQWIALAVAVVVTVGAATTQVRLFVAAPVPAHDTHSLVVMTSNLRLGLADAGEVVAAVRAHHVEVLFTEELTSDAVARLTVAGLVGLLPYTATNPLADADGIGIWSRYPLSDVQVHTEYRFPPVTARVAVPGVDPAPVVAAVHPPGPWPQSSKNWNRDMARLRTLLPSLASGAVAVVGGDFNATPDVAQLRALMRDGYHDAAQQAGAGMTRTYPSDTWFPPLIGIDHVLTRGAVGRSAETVTIRGSDHRALIVRLALP